jgi:uncharacterized integral membrane protein
MTEIKEMDQQWTEIIEILCFILFIVFTLIKSCSNTKEHAIFNYILVSKWHLMRVNKI